MTRPNTGDRLFRWLVALWLILVGIGVVEGIIRLLQRANGH